jgi:hypothetical protein
MTGTNQPALLGTEIDPAADTRKVKYWVTMSLPTYWSSPPSDARPDQVYIYRPDFYQDQDGIERRVTLWFNPKARTTLSDLLGHQGSIAPKAASQPGGAPAIPASPAVSASTEESPARDPFRSPLDESFHPGSASRSTNDTPSASTKAPAPSGTNVPDGLAPLPATNAAPQAK